MKTKILSFLAILMIISVAAGAVYNVSNNTATAKMTLFNNYNNDVIETVVSSDGVNFSENIIIDDMQGGDTVNLTFRHSANEPNNTLAGCVVYKIECIDGLTFKDGQIVDFYNDDMNGTEYEKLSSGLIFTNQNGITTDVNTPDHILIIDNNTAEIRSLVQRIQTFNDTVYTNLDVTFHNDAFGRYTISGTIEKHIPIPTPLPIPIPDPTINRSNSSSGSSDEMTATRTIHTKYGTSNDGFNVTIVLEALTTIQAPVLNEDLPANWTITEINSSNGYFKKTTNEWIWAAELNAGDKITVDYKVNVPEHEDPGKFEISGTTMAYKVGPYAITEDEIVTVVVE